MIAGDEVAKRVLFPIAPGATPSSRFANWVIYAHARLGVYAIEREPTGIKWFVDDKLIHERARSWGTTPIPHLPMQLFINL